MKRLKNVTLMAALALALALTGNLLFAQERSAEDFDKTAEEYYKHRKAAAEKYNDQQFGLYFYVASLNEFSNKYPDFILPYIDKSQSFFRLEMTDNAMQCYQKAKELLPAVPDSQKGKEAKARYYRLSAEIKLLIEKDESGAIKEAELCGKNFPPLGARAFYTIAAHQASRKSAAAIDSYKKAFEYDKNFEFLDADDIKDFRNLCDTAKRWTDLAAFYDQYMDASQTCYFYNMGAFAMTAYEKARQKPKAVLVSIFDREFALSYKEESADEFIQALKKSFGKDKSAGPCVDFVRKFYDENSKLSQDDLNTLPESVRNFLPVRYMLKMKNSDDIEGLRKDFDVFVGSSIGHFYIRLYEKAQKNGDQKSMAEMKEMLKNKRYNQGQKNRLNK